MKRYLIVIEKAEGNWGAFAPDLPGCVALGDTVEETVKLMREAMDMHLSAMAEDGDLIPDPTTIADYIDIDVRPRRKVKSKAKAKAL